MKVDPNNEVVKLCASGIEAEMAGRIAEAKLLYLDAWKIKTNDYEACIVAHYLARMQETVQDVLDWNILALKHARAVNDARVEAFYPSLYLNIGKAFEDMGNTSQALKHYRLGEESCHMLPDDRLGNMTRDAILRGIERLRDSVNNKP